MKVIVLGAGLLGVTSAYFLRQQGHDVTVVDRQAAAAAETSFANGGQISVSHAEPWANPSAPLKVLKWLGQEDAPRPGAMSTRILATDAPCIVHMQKMMRGKVPACLQLSLSFTLFLSLSLPLSLSLSHTYYNAHAHVHIHTHTHAHTKRRACCRSRKA